MIKKETHPEIFKKNTESFKKDCARHPNYGFEKGYIPNDKERAEHGMPPKKK